VRVLKLFVLAWLAQCVPSAAIVEDRAGDDAAEASLAACGLPSAGSCEGDTYRFCEGLEVVDLDCASTGGRCATISGSSFVSCLQPLGARCRTVVPHGNHSHLLFQFCEGATSGCLQDREDGRCVGDLGSCVESDIDRCRGERIIANCRAGQPIAIDCASLGARCDESARACVGVALGAPCDRVRRRCGEGARCQINRGDVLGTCVPDEADAGLDAALTADGAMTADGSDRALSEGGLDGAR
jgi:hypothetical protein